MFATECLIKRAARQLAFGALAVIAAASIAPQKVAAAPQDYRFESVGAPVKSGKGILIKLRLVHASDGKPVAGAIITGTKLDMGPEGMATMTAPAKAAPGTEPGLYQVEATDLMAGKWAVNLEAKVQGEAQPVRGSVTVAVPQ